MHFFFFFCMEKLVIPRKYVSAPKHTRTHMNTHGQPKTLYMYKPHTYTHTNTHAQTLMPTRLEDQ